MAAFCLATIKRLSACGLQAIAHIAGEFDDQLYHEDLMYTHDLSSIVYIADGWGTATSPQIFMVALDFPLSRLFYVMPL